MKHKTKLLLVLLGLVFTLGSQAQVSASSRSWKSWFIEKYFWLKGDKGYYSEQDAAKFDQYIKSAGEASNKGFDLKQE
ncbi:hypothetical protein STRIC_1597 [Streptococcus ictaluri 707-05]|uniref:Uncharacterized protein n=1 Tax=Streptococcus ictaluri 707-05 TaxID=764299 RepID=G5K477_9STRE|nr:hypothetical protein STRIC_1597 [Streptococcus ictaluri 707-05]